MKEWERFIKQCKEKKFWSDFIQNVDVIYNSLIGIGWKETGEYYSQGEQTIHFKKKNYILTIHFSEED